MAVSAEKSARLCPQPIQVDTAHFWPETRAIPGFQSFVPSVNRTAVISHIYRRGTREKSMKPIAEDVIVNAYYIHFDYLLSCIPINGKILKLEGSFVIREVYASRSYNITRFVPTDACHQDCMRNNNIRVSGEMCEESLYDNYEKANQGLVDKLHGSRDTLQDIIDQIDQNIGSLPELSQTSKEIERPARFPNWDSELINRSSAPRRREVSLASVGSE
jgi:hypothetical protein